MRVKGPRLTWKETEIDVQFEPLRPGGTGLCGEDINPPVTGSTSQTPTSMPLKLFTGESDEQSVSTMVGSDEDGGKLVAAERSVHFDKVDKDRAEPHFDPATDIRI